jgi:N-acetylmuramoyl-L-alanine amidase
LTRSGDKTLSLEARDSFAVKKNADLFISIHANASTKRNMSGIETYYLNNATDRAAQKLASRENRASKKKVSDVEHILSTMLQNVDTVESRKLAIKVQGSLMKRMKKKYPGVKNRKVRSALFYVLVGAKCPAILVETSFISNPREEKLLRNKYYQDHLSIAIADGVKRYMRTQSASL